MPVNGFWFKRVGEHHRQIRDVGLEPTSRRNDGAARLVDDDPLLTRKAAKRRSYQPVPKPTQVGRERILRRLSET